MAYKYTQQLDAPSVRVFTKTTVDAPTPGEDRMSLFVSPEGALLTKDSAGRVGPLAGAHSPPADNGILTAEWDYSGTDFVRADTDVTWCDLPAAAPPYPRILDVGRLDWTITGNFLKTGVGSQTYDWDLLADGLSTSAVLSWSDATAVAAGGVVVFEASLLPIGAPGARLYLLKGTMTVLDSVNAVVFSSTKWSRPTINGITARTLGFRYRKATSIVGDTVSIRSIGCNQPIYRSGQ